MSQLRSPVVYDPLKNPLDYHNHHYPYIKIHSLKYLDKETQHLQKILIPIQEYLTLVFYQMQYSI